MALPDSYRFKPDLKTVTANPSRINAPAVICKNPSHANERTNSAGTLPINAAGTRVSRMNFVAVLNNALG